MNRATLGLIIFVPVVALVGLLGWALLKSEGTPGGLGINNVFGEVQVEGGPAPGFELPRLSGGSIALENLEGKVVMLDFWSSWCPPCVAEAPALASTYSQYADKGVEFVGIAIWDDTDAVERHVRRFRVPYPNVTDDRGVAAVDYGVRGIPEKFFIDRQGNIVKKYVGPAGEEDLQAILDELLAGSSQ